MIIKLVLYEVRIAMNESIVYAMKYYHSREHFRIVIV